MVFRVGRHLKSTDLMSADSEDSDRPSNQWPGPVASQAASGLTLPHSEERESIIHQSPNEGRFTRCPLLWLQRERLQLSEF